MGKTVRSYGRENAQNRRVSQYDGDEYVGKGAKKQRQELTFHRKMRPEEMLDLASEEMEEQ